LGFRAWGLGFGVWGIVSKVQGLRLEVMVDADVRPQCHVAGTRESAEFGGRCKIQGLEF